jgi:microcystin-dependent protein
MDYTWYIGMIELFPYYLTPTDFLLCDGSIQSINSFPNLYSVIRNTYGECENGYFYLPNLLGTEPYPYMKYYIAYLGAFPENQNE